ncbi:MAG TPA: hypothetical protein VEJ23_09560, partial [Solirubrobacteraceae bacterium]|nr:hypothetical protein [Solirubrobacteraceae bacterium]
KTQATTVEITVGGTAIVPKLEYTPATTTEKRAYTFIVPANAKYKVTTTGNAGTLSTSYLPL